jgi:hypothetical protein
MWMVPACTARIGRRNRAASSRCRKSALWQRGGEEDEGTRLSRSKRQRVMLPETMKGRRSEQVTRSEAEQIEQSCVETVWQLLRASGAHLHYSQDHTDQPAAGTVTSGLGDLQMQAVHVQSMRLLSASQAVRYQGIRGGGGAILIETPTGGCR